MNAQDWCPTRLGLSWFWDRKKKDVEREFKVLLLLFLDGCSGFCWIPILGILDSVNGGGWSDPEKLVYVLLRFHGLGYFETRYEIEISRKWWHGHDARVKRVSVTEQGRCFYDCMSCILKPPRPSVSWVDCSSDFWT